MSHIIANTYEIIQEIGSGGGGIVYLGKHLRLGKWIVLKADKRTLSTKPEVLRREVDALKNLSHTYIPQVYDFVVEDGVVYTVMDYIEGESLDKLLKRGERPSQAEIIEWACELLDALCYLHSRSPHGILHGDIKPANIMLTPQRDIRLIDFNIALALGEEGAVRIGLSQGYASPEHYGIDYTNADTIQDNQDENRTILLDESGKTILPSYQLQPSPRSYSRSGGKTVLLDVRSDIYSLGATLYHLLTGVRPDRDAKNVKSITESSQVSPAVAAIIQKAMQPDPNQRYQSADEMLDALRNLHQQDPRTRRFRRNKVIVAAALTILFAAGGFCTFTGLKQMEQRQNAYALAEYSANALAEGNIAQALDYALEALPRDKSIFHGPYTAQAQKALTDALGVYDLSDGFKAHSNITLVSEPLKTALSPDGTRLAACYAYEAKVYDLDTGESLLTVPLETSALSDLCFVGEKTLIYAGKDGLQACDLETGTILWTGAPATQVTTSADGSRVAAIYKDASEAIIYNTADGQEVKRVDFNGKHQHVVTNDILADPDDALFALNQTGTMLAVSFSDGALMIYDLEDPDMDLILFDESQYTHFEGGFYGDYLALSGYTQDDGIFVVIDTVNAVQTGGFASSQPFWVQADENGIYLANEDVLVKLHPVTGEQTEVAYTEGKFISDFVHNGDYTLVTTEDKTWWIFDGATNCIMSEKSEEQQDFIQISQGYAVLGSLNSPALRVLKAESHPESEVFSYDPTVTHDEARISADRKTVMLFDIYGFHLYQMDGTLIAEVELPAPEQIYDQQYYREETGSWLEVTYYDGTVRVYSAEDGRLLSETVGEEPDESLYEEFYTDHWKITAPLHEAPVAYDRTSGKQIRTLEEDAYLTYVTQVEDFVVTEYISAEGKRYGLLLDENCETIAYLPNLCDIVGDQLVFDYPSGNMRQSCLYSMQELLTLADQTKEEIL